MLRLIAVVPGLFAVALVLSAAAQQPDAKNALQSGIEKGKLMPAFNPRHVAGSDRGTTDCPV